MAEVGYRPFGARFQEAIDFLAAKLPEASLSWNSLAGPVHAKVFTVAGATSADLARDLQQALVEARANGTTITEFRKQFDETVQRYGWSYNGKRGWRTQVIFDANMRSSAMAGRWAQIWANRDRRPYVQYRTAGDARVRPQHRGWNNLIFRVEDPWLLTHWPPNGWGCRCSMRAYSQADLDSRGLSVSPPQQIKMRDVLDRDGQVVDRVPVGIDPGWDHNVGRSWIAPELALGEALARLPPELRGPLIDKTITPAFQSAMGESWRAWRTGIEQGATADSAHVVGWLDGDVLDGLARAAPGLQVDSTAVVMLGDRLDRVAGWPRAWLDELPAELRSYQAVLWDPRTQQLVLVASGTVPDAPGQVATAVLRLNARTPAGQAVIVERLQATELETLRRSGGQVIVGRL